MLLSTRRQAHGPIIDGFPMSTSVAAKTRRRKGRGAKPRPRRPDPRDRRILELERENRRLRECAQALSEVQEKVSRLLGIPLEQEGKS